MKTYIKIFTALFLTLTIMPVMAGEYKIPDNEKPNVTGLGNCQSLAEQAVYCYVIMDTRADHDSPCYENPKRIVLNRLMPIARQQYFDLNLNVPGNLKEKWEQRTKVLPAVKDYCDKYIIRKTTDETPSNTYELQQDVASVTDKTPIYKQITEHQEIVEAQDANDIILAAVGLRQSSTTPSTGSTSSQVDNNASNGSTPSTQTQTQTVQTQHVTTEIQPEPEPTTPNTPPTNGQPMDFSDPAKQVDATSVSSQSNNTQAAKKDINKINSADGKNATISGGSLNAPIIAPNRSNQNSNEAAKAMRTQTKSTTRQTIDLSDAPEIPAASTLNTMSGIEEYTIDIPEPDKVQMLNNALDLDVTVICADGSPVTCTKGQTYNACAEANKDIFLNKTNEYIINNCFLSEKAEFLYPDENGTKKQKNKQTNKPSEKKANIKSSNNDVSPTATYSGDICTDFQSYIVKPYNDKLGGCFIKSGDNTETQTENQNCNALGPGEYKITSEHGIIKGTMKCTAKAGEIGKTGSPGRKSGNHCWCKLSEVTSETAKLKNNVWVYVMEITPSKGETAYEYRCDVHCASNCASLITSDSDVCNAMINTGVDTNSEKDSQNTASQSKEKIKTTEQDTRTAEQKAADLQEKTKAYDEAKAKEQSKENKMLTVATTAATGIGGIELARGLSEQSADKVAEQNMSAYLATFRCKYGDAEPVKAGPDEIELPGGNDANMMKYRNEYFALANDLKERKTALGMNPGIENQEILDKSQTGLYDDESVGIDGGAYASLYRAQMLNSEQDQQQIDKEKKESKNRVIAGAVVGGVGVVGGAVGDSLINGKLGEKIKEKKETEAASKENQEVIDLLIKKLNQGGITNAKDLDFTRYDLTGLRDDIFEIEPAKLSQFKGQNASQLINTSNKTYLANSLESLIYNNDLQQNFDKNTRNDFFRAPSNNPTTTIKFTPSTLDINMFDSK